MMVRTIVLAVSFFQLLSPKFYALAFLGWTPNTPLQKRRKAEMLHSNSHPFLLNAKTTQQMEESDLPSPSLICEKSDTTQRLAFISSFAVLGIGTRICVDLWHGPGQQFLGPRYEFVRGTAFPISFGLTFLLVGIGHFVFVENFAQIVPPKGTWGGLWQAPSPFQDQLGITYEEYHSYWTGVAEFFGGAWLLAAGLNLCQSTETAASLLFFLTIGVTPANLYMFTHDATPGGAIPKLAYPAGHIARFVVQCGLLSNFWIMAHP